MTLHQNPSPNNKAIYNVYNKCIDNFDRFQKNSNSVILLANTIEFIGKNAFSRNDVLKEYLV